MHSVQRQAFSSPALQAALEKVRGSLEGADEAHNQVSQDVKAWEGYIANLRLTPPLRHSLGKTLVPDDEQHVAASLEFSGCANGKIEEDALILDEDAHGKVRLLYEISRWDGYVEVDIPGGPYFWYEKTLERDAKPLIETKFEIRKRVYGQLPAFVTALAKHYAIDLDKSTNFEDVPF